MVAQLQRERLFPGELSAIGPLSREPMQPAKGDHDALRSLGMSLRGEKMAATQAPVLDVLSGMPRLNSWLSGVAQP